MMVTMTSDQSVSSISKISCSSALELVDRMGDTLVRGEEGGRKVVSVRGSGGLRYTLLRVHPASNVRQEDSHTQWLLQLWIYFLEYFLMAQINLLLNQKLPGIYCILSAMSSLNWF